VTLKVADFGMMKIFTGPNASVLETQCGTPNYMAPELFKGEAYNGPPVDVFALGAVLFLVRFGRFGFLKQGDIHYRRLMKNPELAMQQKKLECEPHLLNLIVGMLHPDAN
jgi:serine/threonine protein kinase